MRNETAAEQRDAPVSALDLKSLHDGPGFINVRAAGDRGCSADRRVIHNWQSIMLSVSVTFMIGVSAFGAASDAAIRGPVTAAKVDALIDSVGPRTTIRQLFRNRQHEQAVVNGIATGEAGWLRVAERLEPESDGHAGESLVIAIQEALPKNPSGVLNLVHRDAFHVVHACGGYGFGQVEDARPTPVLLGLVDKRIEAVRGIEDPHLVEEQQACMETLGNLRSILERLQR